MCIHLVCRRRHLSLLIAVEFAFVLIFLADKWAGTPFWVIHRFFDLDAESNIPAWFASIQLFLIGIVLWMSAGHSQEGARPSPWFLYMAACGFIFLSADEAASIHETITLVLQSKEIFPRFSGGHGIWIPIYAAVGAFFLLLTRRQLVSLWRDYRQAAGIGLAGMIVLLAGAVGLEICSYEFLRDGSHPAFYDLEVAMEEFLEMCGGSLMLYGAALFESLRQETARRGLAPAFGDFAGGCRKSAGKKRPSE